MKLRDTLGLGEQIVYLGFVSDDELIALYNCALAMIYPSLYEGFGLPLLEAMACGCPVVASNATSLPEVVGDAGLLCNPDDHTDMADAIEQVISSDSLRATMAEKGLVRVKKFSWQRAAQETLAVYEKVLSGG